MEGGPAFAGRLKAQSVPLSAEKLRYQSLYNLQKQKQEQLLPSCYRAIKPIREVLKTKQFSLHGAVTYTSLLTALHHAPFSTVLAS